MSATTMNGQIPEHSPATREGCRPTGAVVLVTGASTGIGAAIARELAADGWAVAAGYRSDAAGAAETVDAIEREGGSAISIGGDVCDSNAMQRVIEEAQQLGPVLGLVNNAGVRADGLAIQLDDDQWDRVLETNLSAAFRLSRCVLRPMIRARFGRIVNVASVVGPRANAGQANYAAAKAGLIAMTKTIGVEIARRGVTVNAVAPGFIETEMTADLPREMLNAVPARRPGRPDEVAAAVRFLASDAAGYVTATTLFVDGGMSA
ncbi:MAG TPA: 3-oxoacyl-ACP reductase FabG [Solirubrobacteraceae bacterium]|jgi:3-oxoacyl-[acyl-carrier protein] reductase